MTSDSRSCNILTAKNSYSAMRQMCLPANNQLLQYKDKSGHIHRDNGYSSDLADVKQEVTELLECLQELVGVCKCFTCLCCRLISYIKSHCKTVVSMVYQVWLYLGNGIHVCWDIVVFRGYHYFCSVMFDVYIAIVKNFGTYGMHGMI